MRYVVLYRGVGNEYKRQIAILDMAVTPDLFGQGQKGVGNAGIVMVKTVDDLVHQCLVIGNQLTFHFAFMGTTERVDCRAAQALEFGMNAQGCLCYPSDAADSLTLFLLALAHH